MLFRAAKCAMLLTLTAAVGCTPSNSTPAANPANSASESVSKSGKIYGQETAAAPVVAPPAPAPAPAAAPAAVNDQGKVGESALEFQLPPEVTPPPSTTIAPDSAVMIDFSTDTADLFLQDGWSHKEKIGRWAAAETASVKFSLAKVDALKITALANTFGKQKVLVKLNGELVKTINHDGKSFKEFVIEVPADAVAEENVLSFEFPDRKSPKEVSDSTDDRTLGARVRWIQIES